MGLSKACLVCLLACIALALQPAASVAAAEDPAVDVCPANSRFKALPFLKAAKPHALAGLLGSSGALSINMAALTDFVKVTLLPLIGANAFFFALALILLLIFIIWRLFRWCCVVCCCRGSCDLKRAKNDPAQLLFGNRMRVNKGFMFVFGLVAVAFAAYGMATVDKSVTDGAFNVLTSISSYANRAFDALDGLLDTVDGTSDIITKLQEVVTLDIEVDRIVTNLTAVGSFLDNAPSPTALLGSVTALATRIDPDLKAALLDLDTGITSFGTATGATWTTRMNVIRDAGTAGTGRISNPGGMKVKADDLDTKLSAAITANGGGPESTALQTSLQAVYDDFNTAATHWVTGTGQLDELTSALLNGVGANNPLATLRTKLSNVRAIAEDIRTTKADAVLGNIQALLTQYTAVEPVMAGLLAKMVFINNTILVLPAAMQTAYTTLADAKGNLDTILSTPPTLSSLVSNLTAFKNDLPALTPLDDLIGSLNAAETALFVAFPQAETTAYEAWIATVKAAVSALVTATLASGPLGAVKAAVDAHVATPDWPGVQGVLASSGFVAKLGDFVGAAAFGDAAAITRVNTFAATAAVAAAPSIDTTPAAGYITSARAELDRGQLASLSTTFADNMGDVNAAYASMGSPPSAVVSTPKTLLQDIKTAALTNGDAIKAQVTQTVASFRGSTGSIKNMVVGQLGDIRARYQEPAKTYDSYRYTASMALYGAGILFVILVLGTALANYHCGANLSALLLFLITVLYFLLALIMALLISGLYMGCSELEPLAVRLAPASMTPLLRYYFYGEGASVQAVLKGANLVDIDAVKGQIADGRTDVLQGLTGNFVWVDNPANPRNPYRLIVRINTTIDTALSQADGLLALANRTQLFGVYSEVKGYICCSVPDVLSPMWIGLTFAGVFALVMLVTTMFFIGKLDRVPRQDCCGCTCHTRSKYAHSAHPGAATEQQAALPQYATQAGWEHPMGPYEVPNGAVTMQAPWMPLDHHGTVNVVLAGSVTGQRPKIG